MSYSPLGEPERYRSASRARGTGGDRGTAWGAEWRPVWMTSDFQVSTELSCTVYGVVLSECGVAWVELSSAV